MRLVELNTRGDKDGLVSSDEARAFARRGGAAGGVVHATGSTREVGAFRTRLPDCLVIDS